MSFARILRAFLVLALAVPAGAVSAVQPLVAFQALSSPVPGAAALNPLRASPSPALSASPFAPTLAPALVPGLPAPSIALIDAGGALALAPASAPEGLDADPARFARIFDGSGSSLVEGSPVRPRLIVDHRLSEGLPLQAAIVRAEVEKVLPALRESVELGDWNGPNTTLDESCCGDAAPKLAALLRARGFPARLVEAEFHYFVLLDLPEGQIVIDPTIRQFFGRKAAPRAVPTVFVGTIGELTELFRVYAPAKTTRFDPMRIYFSEAAVREERLRGTEIAIHRGGARDLEPLRRILKLPPSHPPGPHPPRLIVP